MPAATRKGDKCTGHDVCPPVPLVEHSPDAVLIRDDIFTLIVGVDFCPALFPVPQESHGFGRALRNFDNENTIMIAGTGIKVFLANFKSKHIQNLHKMTGGVWCGPCRCPFRIGSGG